jgi:eukaryotic-like serine/threonine-protein kinase
MVLTQGTGMLAGRYALDGLLGRGGMADVYRGWDTLLEREVAIKMLRAHAATEQDRARFRNEAKLLAALDHPHLVAVLDAGLSDDVPYLVMDMVQGQSLARLAVSGLPPPEVARIGADLAAVLAYVHDRGIVHRDVKPSNILVGDDEVVRLADFGIARLLGDPAADSSTGMTTGTAAYLAPEQVRGEPVTAASDVYALGLVLLEALTGQRVYDGSPIQAALARLERSPRIPTSLPTGWPRLLTRMTEADPERRPDAATAEPLLRALCAGPERAD